MANELTVSASLAFAKGDAKVARAYDNIQADVAGTQFNRVVQNIQISSYEALTLVDWTAGGYVLFRNLDDTNFIEIKGATGDSAAIIKMLAGEVALLRMTSTAPVAQSDTAVCDLEMILIDL